MIWLAIAAWLLFGLGGWVLVVRQSGRIVAFDVAMLPVCLALGILAMGLADEIVIYEFKAND